MSSRVVFLFSELAQYFLAGVGALSSTKVEPTILHWPINPEAPFTFQWPENAFFFSKKELSREEILQKLEELQPALIYCSGWMDKDYLAVVKAYKKRHPECITVMGMDNPWRATVKQRLASLFFRARLKSFIDRAWVPGKAQALYARHLGFREKDIFRGFYAADVPHFNRCYPPQTFPKRLLFAGRYVEQKGLLTLLEAFQELNQDAWELHCIGTGPLKEGLPEIKGVRHLGFVQPEDLPGIMQEGGVFVLPSTYEPWGVVVHEFAAAGFPMILSDQVGAGEAFLEEGKNGFIFKAGNKEALKKAMRSIMQLSEDQLRTMGAHSHRLAQKNTPETWAATLNSMLHVRP